MSRYSYRLVNVFSVEDDPFSGNPLCVFEDGSGLSDAAMQALALQFNLSETTFILPSQSADAHVRIFTPRFEIRFAWHPTLGTSHVLRSRLPGQDALRLEMKVGIVPVTVEPSGYRLQTQSHGTRAPGASAEQLAAMLGIDAREVRPGPLWVDTGNEQLVVPLTSADAVQRCQPDLRELARHGSLSEERCMVYVFAELDDSEVLARFFFKSGSALVEDPATGSACANLGGFLLATGAPLPLARHVSQGAAVRRPSRLELRVDAERRIFVSGRVIDIGHGVIELP